MDNNAPYLKAIQQMLAQNEQAAQTLIANAQREREKAAAALVAAQQEYEQLLQGADQLRAQLQATYQAHYQADMFKQAQERLVNGMHEKGYSVEAIEARLPLDRETIETIIAGFKVPDHWLRDDLIMGQIAKISYTSQGRGGDVVLQWSSQTTKFWWEFAGGDAVAIVEVPSADRWEAQTGIPLSERDAVIHFLARQVSRDHGSGKYTIYEQSITLF